MGLGWSRTLNEDDIVIHHFGGTGGYTAFIGFNPGEDVGIVLLSNVASFGPFIDRAVMDFLLSDQ